MSEKKWVLLADGSSIHIDYQGLKELFSRDGEISKVSKLLLKYHFPVDAQLDRNGKNNPFHRRRWQAWFDLDNAWQHRLEAFVIATDPENVFGSTPAALSDANNRHLLAIARHASLRESKLQHPNRVSTFTNWIYQLEHASTMKAKHAGIVGEREVKNRRRNYPRPKSFDTDWELWSEDDFTDESESFEISSLKIGGSSMFGKPDYVFMNRKTQTAIIVEVKTSDAEAPADGWTNLRAQLWAYAQIDAICAEAVNVILVGEIWTANMERVGRRKTYTWNMSDSRFCIANEALFDCYRRHVSQ